ncbi:cytochrome c, partial [Maribacter sp.]|nr:cytochrome c [Maribacter sp.]
MRLCTKIILSCFCLAVLLLCGCQQNTSEGSWDYEIDFGDDRSEGIMKFNSTNDSTELSLVSLDDGTFTLENVVVKGDNLSGDFVLYGDEAILEGSFMQDTFSGKVRIEDEEFSFTAKRQSTKTVAIDRSQLKYLLSEEDLTEIESNVDHAGIISDADREGYKRGERIYSSNCINCHGNEEVEGSIPLSTKFWKQELKAGSDAYSMYQTISRGYATMPPQPVLTPQEKYDVISYIRQKYLKDKENEQFIVSTPGYLAGLPKGTSRGSATKPYQPWADMNYGNFLINTYELADEKTGIERYHSPRPVPYPDENYLENNFAYKGIAVRLDKGEGGVSKGKAWMIFDHDL